MTCGVTRDRERQDREEVFVPANGDAVLADAAEAEQSPLAELGEEHRRLFDRRRRRLARRDEPRVEGLDLEAVDCHDAEALAGKMVHERVAGRAEPDDEHVLAAVREHRRPRDVERVPASEKLVDLQTPGQVERLGEDTTFARIISLVEEAQSSQAPVQKLADKVSAWLIPVVFVFLLSVFFVTHNVRLIVTLMIFTSPAELGLATPLVMIAAIARAAKSGILVKGGIYLETLAKVDVVVFDKTGTLTANKHEVVRVEVLDSKFTERDLVRLGAGADRRSAHPLAKAVVAYAALQKIETPEPTDFEQLQGRGVKATVEGRTILVGNSALLKENGVSISTTVEFEGSTPVHLAVDGKLVGVLFIADTLRSGAKEAIRELKATGVKRIVMLTGDNAATARAVASSLGVDEVSADLMPEDKVSAISELQKKGHTVAMVGDGINDAPALAQANVGIAMGAAGTQAALEAADIALMTDDLNKIAGARAIARRAYRTIQENLFVGVGVVHIAGITAALLGLIGPIQAAMLHLGPDVLVFFNSVKLLRVRIKGVE